MGAVVAKVRGLEPLEGPGRACVEDSLASLRSIGIFLVPVGELEQWLRQFGSTNKQTRVITMLERLGVEGSGTYVPPGPGDVWEFVRQIAAWTGDPDRQGMPD